MYLSTEDYLQVLRQGDYVRALGWGEFIINKYTTTPPITFDADTMLNLAVFELINHGFLPSDLPLIQILYTLMMDKDAVFKGQIAYAATVLCNAAVQFMVFFEYDLLPFYRTTSLLDTKATLAWMQRDNAKLNSGDNSEQLMIKFTALSKAASTLRNDANRSKEKILYIYYYQDRMQRYVDELTKDTSGDKAVAERLGLAMSLQGYLAEQTILTSELTQKMGGFINKLRGLEPYDWEDRFLGQLIPQPFLEKLVDGSWWTIRFFAAQVIGGLIPTMETIENDKTSKAP